MDNINKYRKIERYNVFNEKEELTKRLELLDKGYKYFFVDNMDSLCKAECDFRRQEVISVIRIIKAEDNPAADEEIFRCFIFSKSDRDYSEIVYYLRKVDEQEMIRRIAKEKGLI